jgi:hypothetical protein
MNSSVPMNQNVSRSNKSFHVDGKLLVVRSGAKLPPFCVKTNQELTEPQYSKRRIQWTKGTKGRGLKMIFSYFTSRSSCELFFGVSSSNKAKRMMLFVAKLLFAVGGLIGMFVAAVFGGDPIVMLGCLAVSIIAMGLLPFGNSPLAIVREENGSFWIKGCGKEFLSRLSG